MTEDMTSISDYDTKEDIVSALSQQINSLKEKSSTASNLYTTEILYKFYYLLGSSTTCIYTSSTILIELFDDYLWVQIKQQNRALAMERLRIEH